ncbi:hypothetical protein, partial [Sinorhizobium meliloti]|uniref:hypothetical protein n=1 Tax=Rhizobium meliloti TaxID=382 RepID=UPI003F15D1F5
RIEPASSIPTNEPHDKFLTFFHHLVSTSFRWTPHAKAHSITKGAGKFALTFWQLVWTDHGRSSDVRSGLDHFGVADCWRLQNSVAIIKFFCECPPIGAGTRSDAATLILRASSGVVGEC